MLSSIRSAIVFVASVLMFVSGTSAAEDGSQTAFSSVSLSVFMSTQMLEPSVFLANASIADWENFSIPYVVRTNYRDKLYAIRITSADNQSNQRYATSYCCFAIKDSALGKRLFDLLKDGQSHLVRVKMRHYLLKDLNFDSMRSGGSIGADVEVQPRTDEKVCVIEAFGVKRAEIKGSQEIDAKFSKTRLSMVQSKDMDYLQGTISARIKSKTKSKYIKKPVLRLVVLTEVNGTFCINEMIMKDIGVNKMSTCGFNSDFGFCESQSVSMEDLSYNQTQVPLSTYSNVSYYGYTLEDESNYSVSTYRSQDGKSRSYVTYRSSDRKSRAPTGYVKFKLDQEVKIIGYRIEMWNNGVFITSYDSMRDNVLKKYDLPEDWYVFNKYTKKFKYQTFIGDSSK